MVSRDALFDIGADTVGLIVPGGSHRGEARAGGDRPLVLTAADGPVARWPAPRRLGHNPRRDRDRERPPVQARTADLFAPGLRGLTIGLISTITLVALESLAIGTVMPIVADELGNLELTAGSTPRSSSGNLIGIVLAGGALDRMPLHRPFAAGLVLFARRAADRRARAVDAGADRRAVHPGAGRRRGRADGVRRDRALSCRSALQPRMFAMLSTAWVVPGIIGPSDRGGRRRGRRLALGVPRAAAAAASSRAGCR